jgi:hypothetical protein
VCAITVIGISSAVVLPVVNSATTSYVNAARARDVSVNTAYAMDRCVMLLRDSPMNSAGTSVDITSVSATHILFADRRGLSFSGGVLTMTDASGQTAPLLRGVESFSLTCLAQNGTTSTTGAPGSTWIYNVTIRSAGFELRSTAFVRARSIGS